MDDTIILKSAILDYINIIEGNINTFIDQYNDNNKQYNEIKNNLNNINYLKNITIEATNKDLLISIKENIIQIEKNINDLTYKYKINQLTKRELELVKRGYSIDEVIFLNSISNQQIIDISQNIFKQISKNCKENEKPICIYLGGQPGAGKSIRSMSIKNKRIENNFVEICIDNYRTYHPNYLEIEKLIKYHWETKTPTENDSPGNDIADFTHNFAGNITDIIETLAAERKYNIIFEWGMRDPIEPLNTMRRLHDLGYSNIVDFIAVHKNISLTACNMRAKVMDKQNHIIRKVPYYFHELCIESLPDSCEQIYLNGYLKDRIIDKFTISTRDNKVVFDATEEKEPKEIYKEYLHNPNLSITQVNNSKLTDIIHNKEIENLNSEIDQIKKEKNKYI